MNILVGVLALAALAVLGGLIGLRSTSAKGGGCGASEPGCNTCPIAPACTTKPRQPGESPASPEAARPRREVRDGLRST